MKISNTLFIVLVISFVITSCTQNRQNKDKNSEKENNNSVSIENEIDYKSLEGTPFSFNNYVCSRKLFGTDLLALLRNHECYNEKLGLYSRSNPHIYTDELGFLHIKFPNKKSPVYEGVIKISANGEFAYSIMSPWGERTKYPINVRLIPVQKEGEAFKIKMEVVSTRTNKLEYTNEVLCRCANRLHVRCKLGCHDSF